MMSCRQKMIAGLIMAAMLALPMATAVAQSEFDDIQKFHENYDWDRLAQMGEQLKQMDEAGLLGPAIFSEKGFYVQQDYDAGYLTRAELSAEASQGATTATKLQTGYAPLTVLEAEVTLTVAKGYYKVEFKNRGQSTLVLEAADGATVSGKGLVSVDNKGNLPFEVTAENAENMAMTVEVSWPGSSE